MYLKLTEENKMKIYDSKNWLLIIFAGFICLLIFINFSNLHAQRSKSHRIVEIDDRTLSQKPIVTVKDYWNSIVSGDVKKASNLRTNKYKNFVFETKNVEDSLNRERLFFEGGWSYIGIEQIKIISNSEWEVVAKIQNKRGEKNYVFHSVVKNKDDWKIFAIYR